MFKKLLAIAAAMTVTACASPYIATPYDRTTANVTTIALADDSLAPQAIAYEVASTGARAATSSRRATASLTGIDPAARRQTAMSASASPA